MRTYTISDLIHVCLRSHQMKEEEAEVWRAKLCDTLQLLVEDANR